MRFKPNGNNPQGGGAANRNGKSKSSSSLSPADFERLKSWMLEIADDALGDQHEEGDGSFRFALRDWRSKRPT
jgi:hypothetical protein